MALEGFQTKAELVYDRLRDAILTGELKPGARINIDGLSRELGISKIPLREAVQRLTGQGLVVQPGPHAGAQVAALSRRELRAVYLARAALEGLTARIAAESVGDAELAGLQERHEQMRHRHATGTTDGLGELSAQFHAELAAATHLVTLADLAGLTELRIRHYRLAVRDEPRWAQVIAEHSALLDALRRRDAAAAEAVAREHVEWQPPADVAGELLSP